MKRKILIASLLAAVFSISAFADGEAHIEAIKAPFHVGKTVMACGILAEVSHQESIHFLNFDKPFPEQTLAIVIFAADYAPFEARLGKLEHHVGARFCARGKIEEYNERLQIKLKNPQFLRLMK